eukprot:1160402-Pelagomonas_calceolata.AAC.3
MPGFMWQALVLPSACFPSVGECWVWPPLHAALIPSARGSAPAVVPALSLHAVLPATAVPVVSIGSAACLCLACRVVGSQAPFPAAETSSPRDLQSQCCLCPSIESTLYKSCVVGAV